LRGGYAQKQCRNRHQNKCIEEGITQAELAKKIHTSAPYVNRVTRNKENIVNKTFLAMMEGLGYDVELHYVRREN